MKSSNGITRLHCPVACTSITLIRDRVTGHVSRVTCSTHTSAVPSVFTLDQWLLNLCQVMFCCIVITANIGPTVQFRPGPAPPYVIVMAHYIRLSGATHWSRVTPYGPSSAELCMFTRYPVITEICPPVRTPLGCRCGLILNGWI